MYIASWNVAGWLTTVRHIKASHKSVESWLQQHNFDVLCLQEVKTNDRNIEQQPLEHVAAPLCFDSFWAPSRVRNAKGGFSGLAGVATFVRKGLCDHANRNILDDGGPLDLEGRCLLTCVGSLAIFNVYIPNDGLFSVNLPLKLKVLRALRAAMGRMRAQGFSVVLCGDLNLTYRAHDLCPGDRRVDIAECLRLGALPEADPERQRFASELPTVAAMCSELSSAWGVLDAMLASRRAEEVEVYVPSQKRKETKWRIFADVTWS